MIYLKLQGRIGNQIFMYACARTIQFLKGDKDQIIIEDYDNVAPEGFSYENSLVNYKLNNAVFIHDDSMWENMRLFDFKWKFINKYIEKNTTDLDFKREQALKYQWLYNAMGVFHMQDGFVPYPKRFRKNVYVNGYFQSEKFFEPVKEEIKSTFRLDEEVDKSEYPNLEEICNRNTVCISIKVQHNAGNPMYDVCNEQYYRNAIRYIQEHVENPLFFICSDNVDYVKENLIDTSKYDVVCQAKEFPVHISLAVMARCKHFIIGNTSFGWWAQYLSNYPDKIVIVPERWYNGLGDWQYDIYTDYMIKMGS